MPTKRVSAAKSAKSAEEPLAIPLVAMETARIAILGMTGLYCHRMSQKASRDLLLGGRKKTAAEKTLLKHHPRDEFKACMYLDFDRDEDTSVFMPAMAFKRAMSTVALEVPGVKSTQINRLIFIEEELAPIYGIPRLRMDITRSSDINRTPDVRTRAYFAEWGTQLTIRYARPQLNKTVLLTLLNNAGILIGVGDNRQERGKGNFGTFQTVDTVGELEHLMGSKQAQKHALEEPQPDEKHGDTKVLLDAYDEEVRRRA